MRKGENKLANASISILINSEYTKIVLKDHDSVIDFAEVILTPEQLSTALSRVSHTPCSITLSGLDLIGKKHETRKFEFEIPDRYMKEDEKLNDLCLSALKDSDMQDWIPDIYYSGQNSFFTKENKHFARAIIRRWV